MLFFFLFSSIFTKELIIKKNILFNKIIKTHGPNSGHVLLHWNYFKNLYMIVRKAITERIIISFTGLITDIDRRVRNSHTAVCNGVVSYGALIGGIWVFANHTHSNKCKQNASMILALRTVFYVCLSSSSDRSKHRTAFYVCLSSCSDHSTYAPDESRLFWLRENPNAPNLSPVSE